MAGTTNDAIHTEDDSIDRDDEQTDPTQPSVRDRLVSTTVRFVGFYVGLAITAGIAFALTTGAWFFGSEDLLWVLGVGVFIAAVVAPLPALALAVGHPWLQHSAFPAVFDRADRLVGESRFDYPRLRNAILTFVIGYVIFLAGLTIGNVPIMASTPADGALSTGFVTALLSAWLPAVVYTAYVDRTGVFDRSDAPSSAAPESDQGVDR